MARTAPERSRRRAAAEETRGKSPRPTLQAVNQELLRQGHDAFLTKGDRYFFFRGAEVNSWLDRTVAVARIGDLSVEQWLQAFRGLKRKNQEIARTARRGASRRQRVPRRD